MNIIYVDNAATTKMSAAAIDAMLPYLDKCYYDRNGIDYDRTKFELKHDCEHCGE